MPALMSRLANRLLRPPATPRTPGGDGDPRIIDVPAGPPLPPPLDLATDRDAMTQQGVADAMNRVVDEHSFGAGNTRTPVRASDARLAGRLAVSEHREVNDRQVGEDLRRDRCVARRDRELQAEEAAAQLRSVEDVRKRAGEIVSGKDPANRRWAAPGRLRETRRRRRLHDTTIFAVAIAVDVPFAFLALQILGESRIATYFIALLAAGMSVLGAHYLGVLLRIVHADRRRGFYVPVAALAILLVVVALWMSRIRVAYLSTPIPGPDGQTTPSGLQTFHISSKLMLAGWVAVTAGIWLAVAIHAYLRHNPHLHDYQDAVAALPAVRARHIAAQTALTNASEALANAEAWLADIPAKWAAHRDQLAAHHRELEHRYYRGVESAAHNPDMTTAIDLQSARRAVRPEDTPADDARAETTVARLRPRPASEMDARRDEEAR